MKERAKTIDFKVLGVASTTELKEKVEKGATTLEVADADAFEEQGSASIADAKQHHDRLDRQGRQCPDRCERRDPRLCGRRYCAPRTTFRSSRALGLSSKRS